MNEHNLKGSNELVVSAEVLSKIWVPDTFIGKKNFNKKFFQNNNLFLNS